MEALFRYVSGLLSGVASLFAPVSPTVACALLFVCADFVSGVAASRAEALRAGRRWYFESREAWRTLFKAGFLVTAIAMSWILECCVLDFVTLHITKMLTGFACGVEFWSFLENASVLSDAPLFVWMKRWVHRRIEKEAGDEPRV